MCKTKNIEKQKKFFLIQLEEIVNSFQKKLELK